MKRVCKRPVQIDKLVLCYETAAPLPRKVEKPQQEEVAEYQSQVIAEPQQEEKYIYGKPKPQPLTSLCNLKIGESLEREAITLYRVEGKYHDYVYCIKYNDGEKQREWGLLKFGINHSNDEANTHKNGMRKVWLELRNETLYCDGFYCITYIEQLLGLHFHNITALDLALDTPYNLVRHVRRLIMDKSLTAILNGKVVLDRDKDRIEMGNDNSGSFNQPDKHKTLYFKQHNAAHDKTKGVVITIYDKVAEVTLKSNKHYILEKYGNPQKLYRVEVHLNAAEVGEYIKNKEIDYTPLLVMDRLILEDMFFQFLNRVLRFRSADKDKDKKVSWRYLLGRDGVTKKDIQQQGKLRPRKNLLKDLARVQAERFRELSKG